MYNGIGLSTARGSGTNGFVTRNLSAVRKTKEKIGEYNSKEDAAVRPFDIELIEHERRRQAEVRCLELHDMLEEEGIAEDVITEKVNAFRAKLLAERKSGVAKDSAGRPILKDSHEVSMAQEEKNEKAKNAFGIRNDFVPGSSMENNKTDKEKVLAAAAAKAASAEGALEVSKSSEKPKAEKEKKKKRSHKRRASTSSSSSSSSGTSSDEEARRKKRKKDKKKKSKKSHHHHKRDDRSRSREKDRTSPILCACENDDASSSSSFGCLTQYSIHSSSDEAEVTQKIELTSCLATIVNLRTNGEVHQTNSPIEIISLPMNARIATPTSPDGRNSRPNSKSPALHSQYSRSSTRSRSDSPGPTPPKSPPRRYRERSRSRTRSKSRSRSGSIVSQSSGSVRSRSRSPRHSISESRQHSRSNSASSHSSSSSSKTNKTNESRSSSRSVSIPRRRGSPSFLDRRRITSARKRPIPYKRREGSEYGVSSSSGSGANDTTDSDSDSTS